jgi:nitrilase
MKVAAVQMVSGVSLADNLAQARSLLEQAAQAGAELAVLPEYFGAMGLRDSDKLTLCETWGDGAIQRFLAGAARELGLWIVGGTLPLACDSPERVHNSTLVFSAQGECVARYDKIHLFRFDNGRERFDEAQTIQAGREPARFTMVARSGTPWRVGLSVCYDLRFPELYRAHARAGADLLLVPSAFTYTTGRAHWEVLLGPQHAGGPLGHGAGPAGRRPGRGAGRTGRGAPGAGARPVARAGALRAVKYLKLIAACACPASARA